MMKAYVIHVEALDELEGMRPHELLHLAEIGGRRQVAHLAPLVVRRQAVISSALDIESEQIEPESFVVALEQVIGHLKTNIGSLSRPFHLQKNYKFLRYYYFTSE